MTAQAADRRTDAGRLVRTHQAGVWRYLRFLGCDASEADDLTQETFLTVLRDGFEERSAAQTAAYLRTVARNRLLMARRTQNRRPPEVDLDAAETVWAQAAGDDGLETFLDALRECLRSAVTPRVRRALELAYRDRASRQAIATQLDMAPEGVKTLLRRARCALRKCVEGKVVR